MSVSAAPAVTPIIYQTREEDPVFMGEDVRSGSEAGAGNESGEDNTGGELEYETYTRLRKLLSELLIGLKFPEVFRCSGKTVSDDRDFKRRFINAFKDSVCLDDLRDADLWKQVDDYFFSKMWPLFL